MCQPYLEQLTLKVNAVRGALKTPTVSYTTTCESLLIPSREQASSNCETDGMLCGTPTSDLDAI